MTIEKTRKMLKLNEDDYSDSDVEEVIHFTQTLARFFLDNRYSTGKLFKKEFKKLKTAKKEKMLKLFTKLGYNLDEDKSNQ
jgi:hypothetical protein